MSMHHMSFWKKIIRLKSKRKKQIIANKIMLQSEQIHKLQAALKQKQSTLIKHKEKITELRNKLSRRNKKIEDQRNILNRSQAQIANYKQHLFQSIMLKNAIFIDFFYRNPTFMKEFDSIIIHDTLPYDVALFAIQNFEGPVWMDLIEVQELNQRTGRYFREIDYYSNYVLQRSINDAVKRCDGLIFSSPYYENLFTDTQSIVYENYKGYSLSKDNKRQEKVLIGIGKLSEDRLAFWEDVAQTVSQEDIHIHWITDQTFKECSHLVQIDLVPHEYLSELISKYACGIIDLVGNQMNIRYAKPNRYYDFLYARTPFVVSNDCEFLVDEINGKYGYGFESNSIESAVEAIDRIISKGPALETISDEKIDIIEKENSKAFCDRFRYQKILLITVKDVNKNARMARMQEAIAQCGGSIEFLYIANGAVEHMSGQFGILNGA